MLAFVVFGAIFTGPTGRAAEAVQAWITRYFGWYYILVATVFLVFVLFLLVSRFGDIRLGPDGSVPRYGTTAWFAMLFTAGMGIGLVFYAVAEPLSHFGDERLGTPGGPLAATRAMTYTLFHWGLHPWAIYIVLGLAMGYFHYQKGLPMRPASALYPLLGDRVYGWPGNVIDVLAVFGTLFGLATSIGIGAQQINAGLAIYFGLPDTVGTEILIIVVVQVVAVASVAVGLDRGIRRLSVVNLWLAAALMIFVFAAGPKLFILTGVVDYLGSYLQGLVDTSLYVARPGMDPQSAAWQADWTLFYWGWWISWSPFVGMFIARISEGRTIRQFIAGALIAPVGASVAWFSVFGGTALFYEEFRGAGNAEIAADNPERALFLLLGELPVPAGITVIVSLVTIVLVALFFATSSDPGSLVVDMLTNGGDPHPVRAQRIFWAVTEGLVAMVLLVVGGLTALQTASITTGLPFSLVLIVICVGLMRALRRESAGGRLLGARAGPARESTTPARLESTTPARLESTTPARLDTPKGGRRT